MRRRHWESESISDEKEDDESVLVVWGGANDQIIIIYNGKVGVGIDL